MFKKLIAIAFVLLVPMQAMAALTMNLQMQALQSTASGSSQAAVHHPCHSEVSSMSTAEEAAAVNPSGCYSCALCMAFGLHFDSFILVTADHLTQSVPQFTQALVSADLTNLSKPPIL